MRVWGLCSRTYQQRSYSFFWLLPHPLYDPRRRPPTSKNCYPNEPVIVHPECRKEVRDASDYIAGTGGMVTLAKEHPSNKFIIGTEEGMIYRLKTLVPTKSFHLLSSRLYCPNMKKTTLENLLSAIENQEHEIVLPKLLMDKARASIQKMLQVA
jgi:quinolinate synthase